MSWININKINILTMLWVCLFGCATPLQKAETPASAPPSAAPTPPPCVNFWEKDVYGELEPFLATETRDPIKRSVSYRVMYGETEAENLAMNRVAILGIRIYQKDLKKPKIYEKTYAVHPENKGVLNVLPAVFPKVHAFNVQLYKTPTQPDPKQMLTLHVQELYLFIPLKNLSMTGSLAVKFEKTKDPLKFENLPLPSPWGAQAPDPDKIPDPAVISKKIAQALCF